LTPKPKQAKNLTSTTNMICTTKTIFTDGRARGCDICEQKNIKPNLKRRVWHEMQFYTKL